MDYKLNPPEPTVREAEIIEGVEDLTDQELFNECYRELRQIPEGARQAMEEALIEHRIYFEEGS